MSAECGPHAAAARRGVARRARHPLLTGPDGKPSSSNRHADRPRSVHGYPVGLGDDDDGPGVAPRGASEGVHEAETQMSEGSVERASVLDAARRAQHDARRAYFADRARCIQLSIGR